MRCLYVSYDGLLDPLGQSQIIPYIIRLASAGHTFTIISYEKLDRPVKEILALERKLNIAGIEWLRLSFKSGKVEFAKRLIKGIMGVRKVCHRIQPDIIHVRGFIPVVIYWLSRMRIPHIYDFRGFAIEEWVDIGKTKLDSTPYKILRWIDHRALETSCGVVVLERSAEALLRETYQVPDVPLKVIRTCTDVTLYSSRHHPDAHSEQAPLNFVHLGGARRPYRPDLALRLVSQLLEAGFDCRIDFLNERDHDEIRMAADEVRFPLDKMTILKLDQKDVPEALEKYACGLVFLDSSPWRRVCSPTKLGEYFAAGLPVISIKGIDVIESLAMDTGCVSLVPRDELMNGIRREAVDRLVSFIRRPGIEKDCQDLAYREFSLDRAGQLYTELYAEIEARL